jgi:anthranilate synthase component 1
MNAFPQLDQFLELYRQFEIIPVYRRLLSDHLTPVSAFRLLDSGTDSAGLFESVVGGEKIGRYSFIAVGPRDRIVAYGNQVTHSTGDSSRTFDCDDPLEYLSNAVGKRSIAPVPDLPPFVGGAIGYAAYDVVRYVEHLPNPPKDDRNLPDLDFGFYDQLVVFDHANKTISVIVLARSDNARSAEQTYQQSLAWIQNIVDRLDQPPPQIPCTSEPIEIYRSLRVINPSPFMFLLRTPECTLVGSSPEVMARVFDRTVTVRPLAGTRPRGKSPDEDAALAKDLLADPKERAEHVMLVDLGRNDVGRVAEFGSVQLTDLMVVENYSHVMHISSNVQATLRKDLNAMDAFRSCLPAGTVSGAPKVRAMEIIDELEPTKRGPYAGAVGYFDYRGNMDTCITLRTIVIQNGKVYIQAGAGLVADSVPENEYQETVNKAKALLAAIEVTMQRDGTAK